MPSLQFGTSYQPATFQTISQAFFTAYNKTMVYTLGGTVIAAESLTNNTIVAPVTLFTAAATIVEMQYYKGTLYWLSATLNVYKAISGLATAISATVAVTSGGIATDFAIYKDTLYYTTATGINTCTLSGTGTVNVAALLTGPNSPCLVGSSVYYVDSSSNLKQASLTTVIMANVRAIQTEGINLYINDTSDNLYVATVTSTTLGTMATLTSDCLYCCIPEVSITTPASTLDQVYLPVITRGSPQLLAIGSAAPYNFLYPSNLFTELLSYQMAIDFRIKAGQDPTTLAVRLGSRDGTNKFTGLWLRMYESLKRDDYQPQRISNRYGEQNTGVW
jgi:hypothetical protein